MKRSREWLKNRQIEDEELETRNENLMYNLLKEVAQAKEIPKILKIVQDWEYFDSRMNCAMDVDTDVKELGKILDSVIENFEKYQTEKK